MSNFSPKAVGTSAVLPVGGNVPVLAVWGGIGFSRRPLKDLRDLYVLYREDLHDFVKHCSGLLRTISSNDRDHDEANSNGNIPSKNEALKVQMDLLGWLEEPSARPRRAPALPQVINTAVTTILQMSRYVVLAKRHEMTPGQLARHFTAFAGHSVGMTVAIGMASADSWSSLYEQAEMVLLGTYLAERSASSAWDQTISVPPATVTESIRKGEGSPTPMLSVTGISQKSLVAEMDSINEGMSAERKLHLALINDIDSFVVAGGPEGLVHLCTRLRAPQQQSPSPSIQPSTISLQFVSSTAPFHSPLMRGATSQYAQRDSLMNCFVFDRQQLLVPVWGLDGLLKKGAVTDKTLASNIVDLIISEQVDWPSTIESLSSRWQVLDFGPGGFNGIGMFIQKLRCRETYVVYPAGILGQQAGHSGQAETVPPVLTLLSPMATAQTNYDKIEFRAPHITNTKTPTKERAVSRFTENFGLPRVLVAGMTPTTCDVDFVAVAMNAGFYAEFATGGYYDAPSLSAALRRLCNLIPERRFVTVNIVYANSQGLSWIIPLLSELIGEGYPIGGLVIGAGVPDAEVVAEYVKTLQLCHIGFKPATLEAIYQVLDIAKQHPTLPVMLQWTGGRAGGHHWTQDFHQPLLASYAEIRDIRNVILVAGSGFGDTQSAWPYILGSWSQSLGRTPMPFDAVLVGTCATVTRESKLSLAAKKALVECEGLSDAEWSTTCAGPQGAGGVVSITSHLGEPMHVVATRSTRLWAKLDQTLFKKSKETMLKSALDMRAELIADLNAHHQKIWFAWDYASNQPANDLEDMTYLDVLRRLLQLMHPTHKGGWTHPSYREVFLDFLIRTLERFKGRQTPVSLSNLSAPEQLKVVAGSIPECGHRFLAVEDVDYFVSMCKRRGRKPVPFIPVLDADFMVWFKKDPLWEAENLENTHHRDVGRLCILAGPVAVRYCREVDLPLKEFLQSIERGFQDNEAKEGISSPTLYPSASRHDKVPPHVQMDKDTHKIDEDVELAVLKNDQWLLFLGQCLGLWGVRALSTRKLIWNGKAYPNPIRRLFAARPGATIRLVGNGEDSGYVGAEMCSAINDVRLSRDGSVITATIVSRCTIDRKHQQCLLKFTYDETTPYAPLSEIMHDRQSRLGDFYWLTLFGAAKPLEERNPILMTHPPIVITRDHFVSWQQATDGQGADAGSSDHLGSSGEVPIEFATIVVMDATWRHLLSWDLDVSKLLHQHTKVMLCEGQKMLSIGDEVSIRSYLISLANTKAGIEAGFRMTCTRNGEDVVDLIYHFMFVGQQVAESICFESVEPRQWSLQLNTQADIQALQSKPWYQPTLEASQISAGSTLLVELQRDVFRGNNGNYVAKSRGCVWAEPDSPLGDSKGGKVLCAQIEQTLLDSAQFDPLAAYLKRRASLVSERVPLPSTPTLLATKVVTPDNSVEYASVIRDFNPIHTLPAFARLAGFSGPIYHGNHTAALVLQTIRRAVPQARATTLRQYDVQFLAVVQPGDALHIVLKHVAMENGGPVLNLTVRQQKTEEIVLSGEILMKAPPTAYLFTGQGSQFTGMGLALAAEGSASRHIWDEADSYFKQNWGFLISNIVKHNPTKLTINFSGVQGQRIRQNYLDAQATLESYAPEYKTELYVGLHARSRSHTFHHEDGLLSMTQFAQPALVVVENAAMAHLRQLSRAPPQAQFAGHSLGEFAALSAMSEVLPLPAVLQTVFIRGTLMQAAVPRDARGRSGFGMAAIDPSRIGPACREEHILNIVRSIAAHTGLLIEIVNFNVKGQQYVAAGDKRCLEILGVITNELHQDPDLSKEHISGLVIKYAVRVDSTSAHEVVLKRGKATIPLPGIDVPFHSSLLARLAGFFRYTLVDAIDSATIKPEDLVDRWIPNVTGEPFALTQEYVRLVADLTQSPRIQKFMDKMAPTLG